ncbi:hypothetical protein PEP31012_00864 [Pandoraea eparura]|uniref:Head-tail adaptor protein n=1 Tax=Pandoraea eparura TaxID=2508291 RepID=A0A5E4SKJ5_9BURK|nr:phage head closure protein [Pandoraea eparura]VVD76386.1 hypothetical protein PEP31012_00864 [Pandoraea eparura]
MEFPTIGELNQRIKISTRSDYPVLETDIASDYSGRRDRWAKIEPVGSAVYFGNAQTEVKVTHRIWIRYEHGIDANVEVDDGQSVYRVRRVSDLKGAKRFTVLEVEELGDV